MYLTRYTRLMQLAAKAMHRARVTVDYDRHASTVLFRRAVKLRNAAAKESKKADSVAF